MLKSIESFPITTIIQPWGTETTIARTAEYTGKLLFYRAGYGGGLQYHMLKDESFYLHQGQALVKFDPGHGAIVEVHMGPGESYHIPPGAPHQFLALTDCTVFEASTVADNDRVNVGQRYGQPPDAGTLPTTWSDEAIRAFEGAL